MDLDKAISIRHSVRNFRKNKSVNYRKIIESIDAATKIPLAGNHPSLRYIIIDDKKTIKKLAEAAVQDFFESVEYVVVICSDKNFLVKNYGKRGEMYSRQQAGASIQNLLLKITSLGLSTCWVGAFSDETVKHLLKIPEGIDIEGVFPIGYELGKIKQKQKPDLDDVIFFNEWKNRFMKPRVVTPSHLT